MIITLKKGKHLLTLKPYVHMFIVTSNITHGNTNGSPMIKNDQNTVLYLQSDRTVLSADKQCTAEICNGVNGFYKHPGRERSQR